MRNNLALAAQQLGASQADVLSFATMVADAMRVDKLDEYDLTMSYGDWCNLVAAYTPKAAERSQAFQCRYQTDKEFRDQFQTRTAKILQDKIK